MAGRIPDEFIDEVLQRTDIVAVIGERVPLRPAGSNYKARCPFHDERTPSFNVNPERQTYHCFGCGAHGTAIRFLMEHDRMEFREAIEELAGRVGLEIPDGGGARRAADEYAPLYRALAHAHQFFRDALRNHPARQSAVEYLRRRGISGEVAARFGLGFAPPGWDNLLRQLDDPRPAIRAGLIIEREQKTYDRFRDRITFPIHDRRGRVVAFGARVVSDGEPKYLNSPETPVFHKGREVYGLYQALQAERRPGRLIVVEGYMDVIALTQQGIPGAVATLGTATTAEQATLLLRSADELVLCFDGDDAGRSAALRAVENLLPVLQGDREVRVLLLPEGSDPDDLVRSEGREAFEARLDAATPVIEFFLAHLGEECDLTTVDGRARLLERASNPLRRLPRGIVRETLIGQLAELTRTEPERIDRILEGRGEATRNQGAAQPRSAPRSPETSLQRTPVRHAIALLLQQPQLAAYAGDPDRFADRDIPGLDLLQQLLELARTEPNITTARVLERFRDTPHETPLHRLAAWQRTAMAEGDHQQELQDALMRIEEQIIHNEQKRLVRELEQEERDEQTIDLEQERLRQATRLQLLMDRLKRGRISADEQQEMEELRAAFRL
ncbi:MULTISPECIES: DNA primase [unclassified Halorhodospira]|uniref:DNA primase n=1 Tax=unclassified Halorhodospira TaxID=2626748 RepID=UPI001EE9790F|nr:MULTISPECIES: DNA primase [unclassified Halorhodospira]MCG5540920.1 DNA primase [Halorhodospira sp. M39old]MCG5546339.1 DNA primase [Halorhodospira sp. M38]